MSDETYVLLFRIGGFGSDDEVERLLRRPPSESALEGALKALPLTSARVAFLRDMACDPEISLSRRILLTRIVADESNDGEFSQGILELPPGAASAPLKIALLEEALEAGGHAVRNAPARECALSHDESRAVREAAVRFLCFEVKKWQSSYALTGSTTHNRQGRLNLEALRKIAESPAEKPELRKLAAQGIVEPLSEADHLEARLKEMLNDPRRLAAIEGLKKVAAMKLSPAEKALALFEGRRTLYNKDEMILEQSLKVLFARAKRYAEAREGALPQTLEQVGPSLLFAGFPFQYIPVKSLEDLRATIVLFCAPKALVFGTDVFVATPGGTGLRQMDRSEYEKLVKNGGANAPKPHPFFKSPQSARDPLEPTLFVMMGDGKVKKLTQFNYQDVTRQNNDARKAAGARAIKPEVIERLLKEPYQPGLDIKAEK